MGSVAEKGITRARIYAGKDVLSYFVPLRVPRSMFHDLESNRREGSPAGNHSHLIVILDGGMDIIRIPASARLIWP